MGLERLLLELSRKGWPAGTYGWGEDDILG